MQFEFGKNWISYSKSAITKERIDQAREEFTALFEGINLSNKSFLDIGFGQGLSLLIAQENGAIAYGIDIDEYNLEALKFTMAAMGISQSPAVKIVSILDEGYVIDQIDRFKFDIVHSWGVLHHTGNMNSAVNNAIKLVAENGYFVCAIYNKHWTSPIWKWIKWMYNHLPQFLQRGLSMVFYPIIFLAKWITTGKNPFKMKRGMDFWHNVVDWVGGYPYEYATIDEFVGLVSSFGFECVKTIPAKVPTGCNEFVFKKV